MNNQTDTQDTYPPLPEARRPDPNGLGWFTAVQPPYMDAHKFAKSDPENYEVRPLYLGGRS